MLIKYEPGTPPSKMNGSARRSSQGITATEAQCTEFGSSMAISRPFFARERFKLDHIGPHPSNDIELFEAYTGGILEHLQVFGSKCVVVLEGRLLKHGSFVYQN